MGALDNQPDWDKIAEKFDLWLPQLAPVGEALLTTLAAQPGDRIVDLASGTGEPALTLARRMGGQLRITGIDAAEGMVKVAQAKVRNEGIAGISFQCMPAERLGFDDATFDRALCRFGVMLFDDPRAGLAEMHRVLKPGGRFALAVWSTPESMPTMYWSYQAFKSRIPEDKHPPIAKVTSLGSPGVLAQLLQAVGFAGFSIETKTFHYAFPSFDAYWDQVEASDLLKMQYDALPAGERAAVRSEVARLAAEYVQPQGLRIPHDYLIATGNK